MSPPESNVVPLRSVSPIVMQLDQLDSYAAVGKVARLLREWERRSRANTYKDLARRAGLTPTTVARIASRDTRAPRLYTILMIMKALGFAAVRFE